MDAQAIMLISGSVFGLTQLVKWGGMVSDAKAIYVVAVISFIGVALYGYDKGLVVRGSLFEFFSAWISVMFSAAGVFGFARSASDQITKMRSDVYMAPPIAQKVRDEMSERQLDSVFGGNAEAVRKAADKADAL
jgi:hypothetical protein